MTRTHMVTAASVGTICVLAGATAGIAESFARSPQRAAQQPAASAWGGLVGHRFGYGRGGRSGLGAIGGAGGFGAIHSVSIEPNSKGGFATVTSDAGTITAVETDALTIKEGSPTATYATPTITPTGTVTVMLDWKASRLSTLAAGDRVAIEQSSTRTTIIATDSAAQSPAIGSGPASWGYGPRRGWDTAGLPTPSGYGPNGESGDAGWRPGR